MYIFQMHIQAKWFLDNFYKCKGIKTFLWATEKKFNLWKGFEGNI